MTPTTPTTPISAASKLPSPRSREASGGLHLNEVETPAALVDLDRVQANLSKVMGYLRKHGLSWRPHVKTHKSRAMAHLQVAAGAIGLTVATPREAEVMAEVSSDLLLAHPPVHPKARRILGLPTGVRLKVALDSEEALAALSIAAAETGREVGVLVEVDAGMGRVGVQTPEQAVALARRVEETPELCFEGILFYPGHIRIPAEEQPELLAGVARRVEETLEALVRSGHPARVVSGGSSPTLWQSHLVPGVTEIRAGTCIFHDRDMWTLGVCGLEDVAYSILATVVSTAVADQAVVDAGSKALAKEEFRGGGGGTASSWTVPTSWYTAYPRSMGCWTSPGPGGAPRLGIGCVSFPTMSAFP